MKKTYILYRCFGQRIPRSMEIGWIAFFEAFPAFRMLGIILIDTYSSSTTQISPRNKRSPLTSRRKYRQMDIPQLALMSQGQRPRHIRLHSLELVRFTPVDVGTTGLASTVEDMCGFDFIEYTLHSGDIFHPYGGGGNMAVVVLEEVVELRGDPAVASPDENGRRRGWGFQPLFWWVLNTRVI